MEICDLGEIQGDMLLFGGVYSNLPALLAFRQIAKQYDIPAKNCICTGDIVAYCADAEDSVNHIREFGCPVLAGNCEVQLAANAQDCGCGFEHGSECNVLSRDWYRHALTEVSFDNKTWMGTLPDRILFTHKGLRYAVIHGGATDISRFIWPVAKDNEIAVEIEALIKQVGKIDHVIAGHSGIPMCRVVRDVYWMNTGALGMPSHNGSAKTHFGYLSEKSIMIKELSYDMDVTIDAMKLAGLTQGYNETLKTGYWPSQDTLPTEMRR